MFDTVSRFAKLCHSVSNLEVIHPDKPVRKLYHRREKKRQGLYWYHVMSQIEFTEVLSEHDEKREIVLDDTVKANQSYQFKNLV